MRKTATTSGEDSDFVCERRSGGLDNGTRVTVLDERKVRRTVMCFVDDMDETNAFGRGWIKKDYLEDFETYDNSEECLSCSEVPPLEIPQVSPPSPPPSPPESPQPPASPPHQPPPEPTTPPTCSPNPPLTPLPQSPTQEESQAPEHQCYWWAAECGHCPLTWWICAPDKDPSKGCGAEWGCSADHVCSPDQFIE